MQDNYDYVVIGSSPICMIEALIRCRQGKRAAIVDRSQNAGGAWALVDVFGWKNVEISAHIMRDWKGGYTYIDNSLSIPLEILNPQPSQIIVRNSRAKHRYNYNHKWANELFLFFEELKSFQKIKRIALKPYKEFIQPIYSILHYFMRDAKNRFPKVKYPSGGTRELVNYLETQCRQEGVDFYLNYEIKNIAVDKTKNSIEFSMMNRTFYTKEMGFTQKSNFTKILIDGKEKFVQQDPDTTYHAHFLVNTKRKRRFSFIRFLGDEHYHMISDVTKYASPPKEGFGEMMVVAAWLNCSTVEGADDAKKHFERLKNMGLFDSSATLVDWETRKYERTSLSMESVVDLTESSGGLLSYLETGDLTRDIQTYSPRWTSRKEASSTNDAGN